MLPQYPNALYVSQTRRDNPSHFGQIKTAHLILYNSSIKWTCIKKMIVPFFQNHSFNNNIIDYLNLADNENTCRRDNKTYCQLIVPFFEGDESVFFLIQVSCADTKRHPDTQ